MVFVIHKCACSTFQHLRSYIAISQVVKLGLIKHPFKALNRLYSTQMAREIKIDIISDTVLHNLSIL
jgi:hypothetical protein